MFRTQLRSHKGLSMVVLGAVSALLVGCEGEQAAVRTEVEAASPAAQNGTISPMNQRAMDRQASWQDAIRGLRFEDGLVEVEAPPAAGDAVAALAHSTEGDEHVQFNRKTEAVASYAAAVRAAPNDPQNYRQLASAMRIKGKPDLALACYRTALRLDPNDLEARFGLASVLDMESQRDEAVVEMTRVIELDPQRGDAHERLAIWRYYAGDHAAAWQHVHAARAVDHQVPPQFIVLLSKQMDDPAG